MTIVDTAFGPEEPSPAEVRCQSCNKLLAESLTWPWRIRCYRCGAMNWNTDGTHHVGPRTKKRNPQER